MFSSGLMKNETTPGRFSQNSFLSVLKNQIKNSSAEHARKHRWTHQTVKPTHSVSYTASSNWNSTFWVNIPLLFVADDVDKAICSISSLSSCFCFPFSIVSATAHMHTLSNSQSVNTCLCWPKFLVESSLAFFSAVRLWLRVLAAWLYSAHRLHNLFVHFMQIRWVCKLKKTFMFCLIIKLYMGTLNSYHYSEAETLVKWF